MTSKPQSKKSEELTKEITKEIEKAKDDFKLVPKEVEKFKFLTECAKQHVSGTVWTQDQAILFQTHCDHSDSENRLVSFSLSKELDQKKLAEISKPGAELFFNLAYPGGRLFFKTKLKSISSTSLVFEMPEQLYRVQRRNSFRIILGQFNNLQVEFEDPKSREKTLKRTVFDLSELGLAFIVDAQESSQFKKALFLKRLRFTLNKRMIVLEAEVVYSKPIGSEGSGFFKVGIQFKALKPEDSKEIASFVLAENRKFVSKLIG